MLHVSLHITAIIPHPEHGAATNTRVNIRSSEKFWPVCDLCSGQYWPSLVSVSPLALQCRPSPGCAAGRHLPEGVHEHKDTSILAVSADVQSGPSGPGTAVAR